DSPTLPQSHPCPCFIIRRSGRHHLQGRYWLCTDKSPSAVFRALGCSAVRSLRMDTQHTGAAPERVDFSKIKTSIPIPNLIEVQKNSYERFLQMDLLPNEREDIGLQTVFNSVFPISDFHG